MSSHIFCMYMCTTLLVSHQDRAQEPSCRCRERLIVTSNYDLPPRIAARKQATGRNWQPQQQSVNGGVLYGQSMYPTSVPTVQPSTHQFSMLLQQQAAYDAITGGASGLGISSNNANLLSSSVTLAGGGDQRHSHGLSPAAPAFNVHSLAGGGSSGAGVSVSGEPGYGGNVATTTVRSGPTLSSTAPVFNMSGMGVGGGINQTTLNPPAGGSSDDGVVGPAPALSSLAQPYQPPGSLIRSGDSTVARQQPPPPTSQPPPTTVPSPLQAQSQPPPPSTPPPPLNPPAPTSVTEQRTCSWGSAASPEAPVTSNEEEQRHAQTPPPPPEPSGWNAEMTSGPQEDAALVPAAAPGWGGTECAGASSPSAGWGAADDSTAFSSHQESAQQQPGWGQADAASAPVSQSVAGWGTSDNTPADALPESGGGGGWGSSDQGNGVVKGDARSSSATPAVESQWHVEENETASAPFQSSGGGWDGDEHDLPQGASGAWDDSRGQVSWLIPIVYILVEQLQLRCCLYPVCCFDPKEKL